MPRKHRPSSSIFQPDDDRRELRVLLSSLAIGVCLGAFLVYFFHALPLERKLAAQTKAAPCATKDIEQKLVTCRNDLAAQRQMRAVVPTPAPPMVSDEPPLPKPPPARGTAPVEEPAEEAVVPAEAPQLEAPVEPVPPAKLVWPKGWPPQPKVRPSAVPPPRAAAPQPEEQAALPDTSVGAPIGSKSVTLDVGQEISLGGGYKLTLVGVSRRNSGRYCIVGGNALASVRIASGQKQRVSWRGQQVALVATVKDSNTCQISVQPG